MATNQLRRVTADDRGRVPLGRIGVAAHQDLLVETSDDGVIVLTPAVLVPEREMIIWENPALRDSLNRGLDEASAGQHSPNAALDAALDELDAD